MLSLKSAADIHPLDFAVETLRKKRNAYIAENPLEPEHHLDIHCIQHIDDLVPRSLLIDASDNTENHHDFEQENVNIGHIDEEL